jgi:tetratricopeptide (TPR) repeat protein
VGWEWLRMEEQAQFARISKETDDDVQKARRLSLQAKWGEAITLLQGAEKRLGTDANTAHLRSQVERELTNYKAKLDKHESEGRDRVMITALEEAHMSAADADSARDGLFSKASIPGYRRAFREGGIDIEILPSERVIELILDRPLHVREVLAAALDDWARRVDRAEQRRLSEISRTADPDKYRCVIRDACLNHDLDTLRKLARDPDLTKQPAFTINRLGDALYEEGDLKETVALLRRAQLLHPSDFWITANLAARLCWVTPPHRDDAIRFATAAVALRPESPSVHRRLAVALILRGRTNDARVALQEAFRLDPNDAFAYSTQGWIWAAEKNYEKALADFDKALALYPSFLIYRDRGGMLIDMGDYARAIESYDASIRLNPKAAESHVGRGRALASTGRFRDAIEAYDEAIKFKANDPFTYNCRGLALAREKHDDRAVADFSKAIELYPQFGDAFANRAEVRLRLGDEKGAIEDFGLAIRYGTSNERVFSSRGNLRLRNRDYNGAISDYGTAIQINPRSASAYHERGRAWAGNGQLDKAIQDYDKAIEFNSSYATAFANRGLARQLRHDYDGALTDLDEAIRLSPRYAWAFGRRAEVWMAKKEFEKAIKDCDQAIGLDPSREIAWVHSLRGSARKSLHQYDKALADYDEAIRLNDKMAAPYNQRAWLRAACPDPKYRDGRKAVESATRACELTSWTNTHYLDTLAAACAEAGDFASAIKWQEKAVGLPAKDDPRRTTFDSRVALFEAKMPYHEEPDVDTAGGNATQAAPP